MSRTGPSRLVISRNTAGARGTASSHTRCTGAAARAPTHPMTNAAMAIARSAIVASGCTAICTAVIDNSEASASRLLRVSSWGTEVPLVYGRKPGLVFATHLRHETGFGFGHITIENQTRFLLHPSVPASAP